MAHDSLRADSPAAVLELASLKKLKVGDKRSSELFPALDDGLDWTCTKAEDARWEFDGTFVGLPVFHVTIISTDTVLTLDVGAV